ncbi:MAG: metal-dependent hydrolase [Firmicutes bacterium]|nr:metal-dependent hydrolase [Bacillota bacterium]
MNGHTHIVGGLLAGAVAASALGQSGAHLLPFLAASALAAPLPDVDHPGSMYGRYVPLPGVARVGGKVERYEPGPFGNGSRSFGHVGRRIPGGVLWHRGPTHSLVAAGIAGIVALVVLLAAARGLAATVALGVAVGYLSHLALDELNVSGERLLWPLSGREIRLRWPSVRVGSLGEAAVLLLMLGGLALVGGHDLPRVLLALVRVR